ncbi:hypothetical protein AB0M43_21320 [Longispora sp. NPDC051575]|uniref:hypothetical protein n=1 Tax=Longispora sp. NPDC051575 TaxID=3154943 RepID=UPI00342B6BD3
MAVASGWRRAARVRLARLVVLAAVVTSVALSHGIQCGDATMTHLPVPHSTGDTMAGHNMSDAVSGIDDATPVAWPLAIVAAATDGTSGGWAMLAGACLVFLTAVLVVLALGQPPGTGAILVPAATGPPIWRRSRRPRPVLAQLCILRT